MIAPITSFVDGRRSPGYAGLQVISAMPSKPFPSSEDIYRILEQVLETGVPVEIERGGKLLKIVPVEPRSKLANLKPRKYLLCEPDELVNLDAIDPDALKAARSRVEAGGESLGEVLSELARRGSTPRPRETEENGFPVFAVSEGTGPITLATVQKAFEEAE
jgi:hypothetical protein